ncbi:hypothetical protein [Paenibacillus sp. YYML68]|uniref:hypothetical protein n=1 Tax=Paenibacillus sp. YYML68 TaxID=2909250 RepID=UPI002491203D|nr:hypothetical protein [Paenibacillus sp. YYML68]
MEIRSSRVRNNVRAMTVIDKPYYMNYEVHKKASPDDEEPFYVGYDHGMDILCGSCQWLMTKNVNLMDLPVLAVYECPKCGQLNRL